MIWRKKQNGNKFYLKNNNLNICIHKFSDGWYLSCHKLGITDTFLTNMDFDEAVLEAQKIVMDKATELYKCATDFVKNRYDKNEFNLF